VGVVLLFLRLAASYRITMFELLPLSALLAGPFCELARCSRANPAPDGVDPGVDAAGVRGVDPRLHEGLDRRPPGPAVLLIKTQRSASGLVLEGLPDPHPGQGVWALVLCTSVTIVGFVLLSGPMRTFEIALVLRSCTWTRTSCPPCRPAIQALPEAGSPSASGDALLLGPHRGLGARGHAGFILQARWFAAWWPRRRGGLVVACNILRIAASIWVGLRFGAGDLVLFHNPSAPCSPWPTR
jgi:hypothetical protein